MYAYIYIYIYVRTYVHKKCLRAHYHMHGRSAAIFSCPTSLRAREGWLIHQRKTIGIETRRGLVLGCLGLDFFVGNESFHLSKIISCLDCEVAVVWSLGWYVCVCLCSLKGIWLQGFFFWCFLIFCKCYF